MVENLARGLWTDGRHIKSASFESQKLWLEVGGACSATRDHCSAFAVAGSAGGSARFRNRDAGAIGRGTVQSEVPDVPFGGRREEIRNGPEFVQCGRP